MPNILLEIYILFTMAIVMFICSLMILYLGHKKGTPNTILWALFPFSRGIHWLVECMADYYEEILDREMFIFSQLELITAFISSFILLAACVEYNGMIRQHFGKIIILISSILPLYLILVSNEDAIDEIDETYIVKGDVVSSELFRFSYGFILPLISIIVLICTFLYYYYETRKGKIFFNQKVFRITLILIILIFVFSIFEGFDYYEEEELEIVFISLRAISLAFFVIIPLIIILSQDLGLQKFFLIEPSGELVFAYNFKEKSAIPIEDDTSHLTSGFVSAIMNFSKILSERESKVLSIQLSYLYYVILKTESKLYALQSILVNRHLKNDFVKTIDKIDVLTSTIHQSKDVALEQVKNVLNTNFSVFL